MFMYFRSADRWIAACASLVREGVTFKAYEPDNMGGDWHIELTGGY